MRLGAKLNYFVYNGRSCADWHVVCSGSGTFDGAAINFDETQIPGRHGQRMYTDGTYDAIDIAYKDCWISKDADVGYLDDFRDFLMSDPGYHELWDPYHEDEYRLAAFVDTIEPEMGVLNDSAQFDVKFHCDPRRWLISGKRDVDLTDGGTLHNPTRHEAMPLITLTGEGTLTINDSTIQYSGGGTITLDCDDMTCDNMGAVALSNHDFPVLRSGDNTITNSGFSSVTIRPRWYRL